jgi:hypothetical protein
MKVHKPWKHRCKLENVEIITLDRGVITHLLKVNLEARSRNKTRVFLAVSVSSMACRITSVILKFVHRNALILTVEEWTVR